MTLVLDLPILLGISVVIPAGILWRMTINEHSASRAPISRKFVFLTGEYRKETFFWEFVKIYLKLLVQLLLIVY